MVLVSQKWLRGKWLSAQMDSSVAEGVHSPEAAAARNWWTQEQFRLIAGKWPIQLKHCATVGLCIFWHWHLEYSFIYGAYVWFNKVKRWHRRIYRIYLHNPTKLFDIFEKTTIPIELSSPSPLRKVAPPNKLTVAAAPIVGSQKNIYIVIYIYNPNTQYQFQWNRTANVHNPMPMKANHHHQRPVYCIRLVLIPA